jgi:hypothetical protein
MRPGRRVAIGKKAMMKARFSCQKSTGSRIRSVSTLSRSLCLYDSALGFSW